MPKLKAEIAKVLPERIGATTPYAVLYIRSGDQIDAMDLANHWASEHGMERARELTLGTARIDGTDLFVARCYRRAPFER